MAKGARVIPENILKKQARDAKMLKALKESRVQAKTDRAAARKVAFANAEKYHNEYQAADSALVQAKRDAKAAGSFYVEQEAKVAIVVRIRGIRKLAPKPKKIMQLLRLRQIHNAVFVKLNKATWNMLKMVEPFITYGFPSRQTVSKVIYARGHAKVERRRIPITDNSIISENLGSLGITCIEDVVHEIATCGPNFRKVNNFLWPFKLNTPSGGWEVKRHSFAQGFGAFGNREELINSVIKRMI